MPQSRNSQISLADTAYYHCISRCVRRAYLCGEDKLTGQSFEHRREWVENKLLSLTQFFSIDVCAYAIMSNHTHLVLYVDQNSVQRWSVKETIWRWHQVFKGNRLSQLYLEGYLLSDSEYEIVKEQAEVYKSRLCSISWFMRVLNEHIARKANAEDKCTGRFKSQPLLDEAALFACMAYVDLNPIRAGIAKTLETSAYTSIRKRVTSLLKGQQPVNLRPFKGQKNSKSTLSIELSEYINLVNLSSQLISKHKQAESPTSLSLLKRLKISNNSWHIITHQFSKVFHGAVGNVMSLSRYCSNQNKKRRPNLSACQEFLS